MKMDGIIIWFTGLLLIGTSFASEIDIQGRRILRYQYMPKEGQNRKRSGRRREYLQRKTGCLKNKEGKKDIGVKAQGLQLKSFNLKNFDSSKIDNQQFDYQFLIKNKFLFDLRDTDSELIQTLQIRLALQNFFNLIGAGHDEQANQVLNDITLLLKDNNLSQDFKKIIFDFYDVIKGVEKPKNHHVRKLKDLCRKLNVTVYVKLFDKGLSPEEKIVLEQLYDFSKFILVMLMGIENLDSTWEQVLDLVFFRLRETLANKKKITISGVLTLIAAVSAILFKHYCKRLDAQNDSLPVSCAGIKNSNSGNPSSLEKEESDGPDFDNYEEIMFISEGELSQLEEPENINQINSENITQGAKTGRTRYPLRGTIDGPYWQVTECLYKDRNEYLSQHCLRATQ